MGLQANVIARYTASGDDITYGFGTSDQFYASPGNDTLIGFDGGDTYRFGRGSGQDVIYDYEAWTTQVNVIQLGAGIAPSDVTARRGGVNSNDLILTIAGTSDIRMGDAPIGRV